MPADPNQPQPTGPWHWTLGFLAIVVTMIALAWIILKAKPQ